MKKARISEHFRVKGDTVKERDIHADNAQLTPVAKAEGQTKRAVEIIAEARDLGAELGEVWGEYGDE